MNGTVTIRPIARGDVRALDRALPEGPRGKHYDRAERQSLGLGTYLAAWDGERPTGHLLVRWDGPSLEPMASAMPDCPELEDFFVDPAYRGTGIGRALMEEAERRALASGYAMIGLGVGLAPTYDTARTLYLRRGYRHAGFPLYTVGWWELDPAGKPRWWDEACEYLVKDLAPTDSRE
jgi:GNAT superfamily N-acetyltransferase